MGRKERKWEKKARTRKNEKSKEMMNDRRVAEWEKTIAE